MTYAHFDAFMAEFRTVSGGLGTKMDDMSERLTQVQIKIAGVDKDIPAIQQQSQYLSKRVESASASIKVLEEDRTVRKALEAQANELSQPARTVKDKIIEAVTTALVLGTLAIGYNLLRDSMIKEVNVTPSAHAPHIP